MTATINALRERLGEIMDIRSAIALLDWDQQVNMPPKGAAARGRQLATLSKLEHGMFTAPELGTILAELHERSEQLAPDDATLVEETLHDYTRATRLPESFVQAFAEERSEAYQVWVTAREKSDFSLFQGRLEKLLALLKQKADLLGYEGSPYNALLEDFERGMTAGQLSDLFADVGPRQARLVDRIVNTKPDHEQFWREHVWDEQAQWDFAIEIVQAMGYDLEAGRQDKSPHPFTTNFDIHDVRITTRIDPHDPFSGLMASIHEAGHALYEQGFREEDRRTLLAQAPSLGMHESQSRMWENMVGRSQPFWEHYGPLLHDRFPQQLRALGSDDIFRAVNQVQPSLIRVEADECTYNLHVILRFEIETALMEGRMAVSEIPEAWAAKVRQYLDLDVPDDARGCLQDVHWAHGAFGYFPTYALGNLYAAQLYETALEHIPDVGSHIANGDFQPLRNWLRRHIHQYGRRKRAAEIVRDVTGSEPSAEAYMRYLETKFADLYAL